MKNFSQGGKDLDRELEELNIMPESEWGLVAIGELVYFNDVPSHLCILKKTVGPDLDLLPPYDPRVAPSMTLESLCPATIPIRFFERFRLIRDGKEITNTWKRIL